MSKIKGFTLLEVTISMIIMTVIIICSIPLMTIRKAALGTERSAHACIKSNNTTSAECNTFVSLCKGDSTNNSCKNMITYAQLGYYRESPAQQTFAAKILTRACIAGAGAACDYFINTCIGDSSSCSTSIGTFLAASKTNSSLGNLYIAKATKKYYDDGISNIMSIVDTNCTSCSSNNIACNIRGYGTGTCTCGSAPGTVMRDGTIKVDSINGYNLCTANIDQGSNAWNNGTNNIFMSATNLADGAINTNILLNTLNNTVPYYAALKCQGVTIGGHSDWYLPSKNELILMNTYKNVIGNFDTSANYWSSTEVDSQKAGYLNFSNNSYNSTFKYTKYRIRCVRRDY